VEIVKSTSAEAVIPAIDCILTDFGIPHKMGTDNGPPFSGYIFEKFAKKMGFKHVKVTLYAPWANATLEHFMRNLGKVLKTSNVESQHQIT
jgi:Integrase core domain.